MTSETNSLGEFLRHERERRGVTIEQVASATKIGIRTLHSLEGDNYAELPAKPFIRGFVISYCRFIGLDAKEVLATFSEFIAHKATERPNREGGHSGYAFEKRDGEQQSRTFLFIAIFGFVVVGGVAVLLLKPSFHHKKNSHIDRLRAAHLQEGEEKTGTAVVSSGQAVPQTPVLSTSSGVVPLAGGVSQSQTLSAIAAQTAPSATPVPAVSPVAEVAAKPAVPETTKSPEPSTVENATEKTTEKSEDKPGADPSDPLDSGHKLSAQDAHQRVIFKINEDVWVRYKVDQRPERKFIIRGGKSLVLKGSDKIVFQVSHPERVSFSYNNQAFVLVSQSKSAHQRHGDATLFFPASLAKDPNGPFKDTKGLPKLVGPKPEVSPPTTPVGSAG
ncbi:MAG: helix-turn-helix domain-containing protein [Bdellovibrio sp.]|nr:helix-turn-helix domain-containing protein [Bdellovibrio sp.]